MYKISDSQLAEMAFHNARINNIISEVLLKGPQPECDNISPTPYGDDLLKGSELLTMLDSSQTGSEFKPDPDLFAISEYDVRDRLRKERALKPLCGRWATGGNRHGIEITKAGEHYILTYLKRNGKPTDERYLLMCFDGDILYYGYGDRMTSLALNTDTDVLIVSPGMDYTRIPETQK